MCYISVVLPCLNEEKGIGICINKIKEVFQQNNLYGEIVIVDNGCTDKTVEIAKNMNVQIVSEWNKGYGNAYKAGFKQASGKVIVMGDADNSYDFYEIPRFINELNNSDFVIGNRKEIMKGAMPLLHRYIGNPIFSMLMRSLFDLKISDSHCGFGVIKRKALDKLELKSSGMEFASEILIRAKRQGLKIKEMPIKYYPREGKSKLRTFKDGARHLILIGKEFLRI